MLIKTNLRLLNVETASVYLKVSVVKKMLHFTRFSIALGLNMVVLDNKFVFSNCEKYVVVRAGKICWATCFQLYSPTISLRKDKFSRRYFEKIHRTLIYMYSVNVYIWVYHSTGLWVCCVTLLLCPCHIK